LRSYSDVQRDFYAAFEDLARKCEGFLGHSQTFRVWFGLVVSRYGLENLDLALAGFKIMTHTNLSFSKDVDLAPKFMEFMGTLKKIRGLHDELEVLQAQGIRPDLPVVTA
jgi:hypothetical protein